MDDGIDVAERARARNALRQLLDTAAGPRLKTRWRPVTMGGVTHAALGFVGVLAALVVLAMISFAYLASTGPIDLERLRPTLVAALQSQLGDQYRVALGPTYLTHSAKGFGVGLGFSGIRIADSQGRTLVAAPSGYVGLDVLSLLRFNVSVRRLEFVGLVVNLHVAKNGEISVAASRSQDAASLTFAPPAGGGAAFNNPGALAAAAVEALAGAKQPLDHIAIVNSHLNVDNETLARSLAYEGLSLTYDRNGSGASVAVAATGPSGAWSVSARVTTGAKRELAIEARDLGLYDILMVSANRPGFETDMPISFNIGARIDDHGALQAADGGFALGAGHFRLDNPDHKAFLVDEASGKIHWDAASRSFVAEGLEMLAGESHYRFDGVVEPPPGGEGPWRLRFASRDSVYGPERPGDQPVVIDKAVAEAWFFADSGRFVVDRMTIHGPKVQGELSLAATPQGDSFAFKFELRAGTSSLVDSLRLWPTFINPPARTWCVENIRAGNIVSGTMRVDWDADATRNAFMKRPVPPDSVHAEFQVAGAGVDLLPGVPTVTGLDGSGVLTGHTFEVRGKTGGMDLSAGRRLAGTDIYFRVPNTDPAPLVAAEAGAHVVGGADAVADLLSRDALKPYAGLPLDPAKVKGQAQGQLTITLALGDAAKPEDQKFRVEGSLAGLSVDGYMGTEKFEQGALDVSADAGQLRLAGQGLFDTIPAKVEVVKSPTDEGQALLTLTLDNATRARLGMAPGVTLNGPIIAKLKTQFNRQGGDAEVDLSKAEITGIDGVMLKAAGKPGKATFSMKTGPDGVNVSNLAVDAGNLSARGGADFASDGAMQQVKLTQLRFAASDDLKLDLQGGTPIKASLRGTSLDARGLIKAFLSRDPAGPQARDFDLDAKVDAAAGANDQAIYSLDMTMARRGGTLKALEMKGRLGQGGFSVSKQENSPMRLRAEDGGAAAKFLDFYTHIEGGLLELTLGDESDGSHGVATLRNFTLRNESALQRMSMAAPPPPPLGHKDTASNDSGVDPSRFDRLSANFVRTSGRIDVKDMVIFNSSEGITTQGFIDFAHDKVDMSGTFVPIYAVNNLVTGIPVVGMLLGGGSHEGLFAVNFRVAGPASAPILTINPLSGLTPGIFRKIFGVIDGTQTQSMDGPPAPLPTVTPSR